ncbi:TetR/AcrR family transcriptional regulator [Achromobacter xylosoxidans]
MSTSTTESPATERAADTRDRLLRAGLALFSQLGLEGVRTRQLAQAAGVNQSAIPYHFGGKEGVYAAVLEQTAQAIAERLDWPDAAPAQQPTRRCNWKRSCAASRPRCWIPRRPPPAACCWRANSCNPLPNSKPSTPCCSCPCTKR